MIDETSPRIPTLEQDSTKYIVLLGILVLQTIVAVSILHVNEYEFIQLRFPALSNFEISLYDTVLYISYLIVGIIVGILSDRIGKRKIFIFIGSAGNILLFYCLTIITNYPLLLVLRFCQGAFTVLTWQIIMTLILDISSSKNRGRNMGLFGVFLTIGMGLGPVLGGVLAEQGIFIPYYVSSALSGAVLSISLLSLREPQTIKKNPSLRRILSGVRRHPKLIIPGIFNFIDRLHMGFIIFIVPFFLVEVLSLGESLRGMVLGLYALPLILLSYPMGKLSDRHGRYKQLIIGSIAYGLILSTIGVLGASNFTILIILFIILGIFASFTTPPSMALVGDIVEPENIAIGMGFFNFLGNLGIFIGPAIAGLLKFNYPLAFLIAGLIELVTLGLNAIPIWYFYNKEKNSKFSENNII